VIRGCILKVFEIHEGWRRGNNSYIFFSKWFIFCMCVADIVMKGFPSFKYIEVLMMLKVCSLQFCKCAKGSGCIIFQSSMTLLFVYVLF
jgi:hypothetical protein